MKGDKPGGFIVGGESQWNSGWGLRTRGERSALSCLNEGFRWTEDLNAGRSMCWVGPGLVWWTGHRMVGQSSRSEDWGCLTPAYTAHNSSSRGGYVIQQVALWSKLLGFGPKIVQGSKSRGPFGRHVGCLRPGRPVCLRRRSDSSLE